MPLKITELKCNNCGAPLTHMLGFVTCSGCGTNYYIELEQNVNIKDAHNQEHKAQERKKVYWIYSSYYENNIWRY